MQPMEPWQVAILLAVIVYVGACFGLLARRHGRNPILWGALSILSPVNLVILGYWAVTRRLPFGRA
jgi:hypothetical protein